MLEHPTELGLAQFSWLMHWKSEMSRASLVLAAPLLLTLHAPHAGAELLLNAAFVRAVREPDIVRQITEQGAQARAGTPSELAAFIASETERIVKIVRAVGAKGE
jgi:hypothetical protein